MARAAAQRSRLRGRTNAAASAFLVPGRAGLALRGVPLEPLLAAHGSPLFVLDAARLEDNARRFLRAAALHGAEVCYSVKTCPLPEVLLRLAAAGLGGEVISPLELELARRTGLASPRLVVNGPALDVSTLTAALSAGALVNLNHAEQVPLAAAAARRVDRRVPVGLRVALAGADRGQLGEPLRGGHALRAARAIAAAPELELAGLHAHPARSLRTVSEIRAHAVALSRAAVTLAAVTGAPVPLLDMGGGLASPEVFPLGDTRAARAVSLERYVELVAGTAAREYRRAGAPSPRILLEPGRALVGDAVHLLARVVSTKRSGAPGAGNAVLDAGLAIAEPLRRERHRIVALGPARGAPRAIRLAGPVCTPEDELTRRALLPPLEPGDGLAILDAGAYFLPSAASFSFLEPAVVVVEAGSARVARRAETIADWLRRDGPAFTRT